MSIPILPTPSRLARKYRKAKYAPKADCTWCHGAGEVKKKGHLGFIPCMCIFVQHDQLETASRVLGQATAEWFHVNEAVKSD